MKGWEPQLPTAFPIERIQRDAVRVAAERRRRRMRRNQRAMSGLGALLIVGTAAIVVARDEPPDQLRAGPGPAGSA
ncbi:MAG: hypothetical protein M3450_17785, partial [Actinomycetota bacterium]|nr:hypothetical protein [Actinomycetota bacterium]